MIQIGKNCLLTTVGGAVTTCAHYQLCKDRSASFALLQCMLQWSLVTWFYIWEFLIRNNGVISCNDPWSGRATVQWIKWSESCCLVMLRCWSVLYDVMPQIQWSGPREWFGELQRLELWSVCNPMIFEGARLSSCYFAVLMNDKTRVSVWWSLSVYLWLHSRNCLDTHECHTVAVILDESVT